jgi:hypothetical protein
MAWVGELKRQIFKYFDEKLLFMLLVDSSLINARTQIYKNFNRFLADS